LVFIHPSSTLFKEGKYDENILIFGSKVSTSKIFVRDCTAASGISLLLLGGDLKLMHDGIYLLIQGNTLVIDNLRFRSFPRITVLVNGMRSLLDMLLDQKFETPNYDILASEIGSIIVDLLSG
jgi:hypothetical protein